jgi:hypothetical protein
MWGPLTIEAVARLSSCSFVQLAQVRFRTDPVDVSGL